MSGTSCEWNWEKMYYNVFFVLLMSWYLWFFIYRPLWATVGDFGKSNAIVWMHLQSEKDVTKCLCALWPHHHINRMCNWTAEAGVTSTKEIARNTLAHRDLKYVGSDTHIVWLLAHHLVSVKGQWGKHPDSLVHFEVIFIHTRWRKERYFQFPINMWLYGSR